MLFSADEVEEWDGKEKGSFSFSPYLFLFHLMKAILAVKLKYACTADIFGERR